MLSTYRLPDALPGEQIKAVIHRDAFIAVKRVIFFALLLAAPVLLIAMINLLFPSLIEAIWVWPALLLAASAYVFFVWLLFFFSLLDYMLDVWIITDRRVIDVRQSGFFSRSISEVKIDRIQDVSSEMTGFLPTMLKYGNVIVQTASEQSKLFFEEVNHPEHVRDMLTKLMAEKPNMPNQHGT